MNSPREPLQSATPHDPAVDAAYHLVRVLDRFGDAVAGVDTTELLAVEAELGDALAALSAVTTVEDRVAARAAVAEELTALARCRRLGASFSSIARLLERAGRSTDGYDRAGPYVVLGPGSLAQGSI